MQVFKKSLNPVSLSLDGVAKKRVDFRVSENTLADAMSEVTVPVPVSLRFRRYKLENYLESTDLGAKIGKTGLQAIVTRYLELYVEGGLDAISDKQNLTAMIREVISPPTGVGESVVLTPFAELPESAIETLAQEFTSVFSRSAERVLSEGYLRSALTRHVLSSDTLHSELTPFRSGDRRHLLLSAVRAMQQISFSVNTDVPIAEVMAELSRAYEENPLLSSLKTLRALSAVTVTSAMPLRKNEVWRFLRELGWVSSSFEADYEEVIPLLHYKLDVKRIHKFSHSTSRPDDVSRAARTARSLGLDRFLEPDNVMQFMHRSIDDRGNEAGGDMISQTRSTPSFTSLSTYYLQLLMSLTGGLDLADDGASDTLQDLVFDRLSTGREFSILFPILYQPNVLIKGMAEIDDLVLDHVFVELFMDAINGRFHDGPFSLDRKFSTEYQAVAYFPFKSDVRIASDLLGSVLESARRWLAGAASLLNENFYYPDVHPSDYSELFKLHGSVVEMLIGDRSNLNPINDLFSANHFLGSDFSLVGKEVPLEMVIPDDIISRAKLHERVHDDDTVSVFRPFSWVAGDKLIQLLGELDLKGGPGTENKKMLQMFTHTKNQTSFRLVTRAKNVDWGPLKDLVEMGLKVSDLDLITKHKLFDFYASQGQILSYRNDIELSQILGLPYDPVVLGKYKGELGIPSKSGRLRYVLLRNTPEVYIELDGDVRHLAYPETVVIAPLDFYGTKYFFIIFPVVGFVEVLQDRDKAQVYRPIDLSQRGLEQLISMVEQFSVRLDTLASATEKGNGYALSSVVAQKYSNKSRAGGSESSDPRKDGGPQKKGSTSEGSQPDGQNDLGTEGTSGDD